MNMLKAQNDDCSDYCSDNCYYRYTASGYQDIINGNHSKARNESYKMANITAVAELSKMVSSTVTRVMETMTMEDDAFFYEMYSDTALISSYKVFKNIKTICRSETKLIGNTYVTYVTKEISLDNICNMIQFKKETDKQRFRKLLEKK